MRPINLSSLLENYCKEHQIDNIEYDYFADLPEINPSEEKLQSLLRSKKKIDIGWNIDFSVCPEQKKALLRQVDKVEHDWEVKCEVSPIALNKLLRKNHYNEKIAHIIEKL